MTEECPMAFGTADEANRFLVTTIIQEAARGDEPLSAIDEHELRTPGCGHTADEDEAIDNALPAGYSHWALRVQAAQYLRRAYYAEATDDVTRSQFKAAYAALRNSPYILTNLSHADSPLLNAVEWLHVRPALESATAIAFARFGSVARPQAAGRPIVVAVIAATVMFIAALAAATVLRR
jgi:hypothetical protein